MTSGKKRVLICGEASFLSTGFSAFNREILNRLHKTGKYELAEFGSYAPTKCKEGDALPWKFYGVLPATEQEKKMYESSPHNQFGKYKIDAVLADFQPDIVFDPRDPWMVEHLQVARFRDNFKLFLCPTVDSAPQKRQWVEGTFKKADVVTTYSRYGKRVLEKDGVKVTDVTSPGLNLDKWKPLDSETIRDYFAVKKSLLVFGTVMRNQKRKLYPDLFDAYSRLRKKWVTPQKIDRIKKKVGRGEELAPDEVKAMRIQHSVLLCHTSWPDVGWNIPSLLQRYGIQRHTLFTYKCDSCSYVYVHWFSPKNQKGITKCRKCGEMAAHMPSTHSGISEEELIKVFNLIDIYIQPAICEGWGLPIMESKACGIAGLYQNYSAMEDHVENGGGLPIKIKRFYHEAETEAIRSLPDIDDMADKMELLALDKPKRDKLASQARACALRMHSWDMTGDRIEGIISRIETHDRSATWDSPPSFDSISQDRPNPKLTDEQFINWCYHTILCRSPDQKGFDDWMTSLNSGSPRENVEAFFRDQVGGQNKFEEIRWLNSLKIRGISLEPEEVKINQDVMPGMVI